MNGRPSRKLPSAKPAAVGPADADGDADRLHEVGAGEHEAQVAADAHPRREQRAEDHAGAEDRPEQIEPRRIGGQRGARDHRQEGRGDDVAEAGDAVGERERRDLGAAVASRRGGASAGRLAGVGAPAGACCAPGPAEDAPDRRAQDQREHAEDEPAGRRAPLPGDHRARQQDRWRRCRRPARRTSRRRAPPPRAPRAAPGTSPTSRRRPARWRCRRRSAAPARARRPARPCRRSAAWSRRGRRARAPARRARAGAAGAPRSAAAACRAARRPGSRCSSRSPASSRRAGRRRRRAASSAGSA